MSLPDHFSSVDKLLAALGTSRAEYFGRLRNNDHFYTEFTISGKNKDRIINAPSPYLKKLQKKLLPLLNELYQAPATAHGFIKDKSITSNAKLHCNKHLVFNIDIKDFFPTITQRRIAGLLRSQRYGIPRDVAYFISKLVTFNGALPQGGPASPILSNMICAKMDSRLLKLAKECKAHYTRYADDITFSTTLKKFHHGIMYDLKGEVVVGEALQEILSSEWFEINPEKTRVASKSRRQQVTGVIVNKFTNVNRSRVKEVQAILYDWHKNGYEKANEKFLSLRPYRKHHEFAMRNYVAGQISFISMVRPKNDEIVGRLRLMQQKALRPNDYLDRDGYLQRAQSAINTIESLENAQDAGYLLEDIITDLASADEIFVSSPFKVSDNSMQVDGCIKIEGHHYWVECKWWKDKAGAPEIKNMIGGMDTKGIPDIRGIYISRSGYTQAFLDLLKAAHNKHSIIIIDYPELLKCIESKSGIKQLIIDAFDKLSIS